MGIASWVAAGVLGFVTARLIPHGRPDKALVEAVVAVAAGVLFGLVATYLDFGGWRELDWRAPAFAACGVLATLGLLRVAALSLGLRRT